MGKRIRVTPEELDKASTKLAEISRDYAEIYKKLITEATTMGEAWEGEDNMAFVNQINGFCDELKTMADKLQTASDALQRQKSNYQSRQDSNVAEARSLTN